MLATSRLWLLIILLAASSCYAFFHSISQPIRSNSYSLFPSTISSSSQSLAASTISTATTTTTALEDFLAAFREVLALPSENFVSLHLKDNALLDRSTLSRDDVIALKEVQARLVQIKKFSTASKRGGTGYGIQLQYRYLTNDQVKNFPLAEADTVLLHLLQQTGFRKASLLTADRRYDLSLKRFANNTIKASTCQIQAVDNLQRQSPLSHDRPKETAIPLDAPFLQPLGISYFNSKTQKFELKVEMASKYRQVRSFVDLLRNVAGNLLSTKGTISKGHLIDMGCGKGYLTFAAHHFLSQQVSGWRSTGVELRPELVNSLNQLTQQLASQPGEEIYSRLSFEQGSIENYSLTRAAGEKEALIVVGLHACDIATDDLLSLAVDCQADLILAAPCCQKEVRPALDKFVTKRERENNVSGLQALLSHGLFRTRMTDLITDSLRCLCLQALGYDVKVVEFVDASETAKNVLLCATRRPSSKTGEEVDKAEERRQLTAISEIQSLMRTFEIPQQRLVDYTLSSCRSPREVNQERRLLGRQLQKRIVSDI
eukprot:gene8088-8921_t